MCINEIILKKKELRKKYKQIRSAIPDKTYKSKIITNKIINDIDYKNAKIIALFKSFGSEVDTDEIIIHSINNRKIVVLPRVVGDKLKFYKINSINENLLISSLGVAEPIENEENYIESKKIDLIIVPGLCFDKENNRLGYGKGYYDKILRENDVQSIAICFKEQILENEILPTIDSDVKVKKIITD